MLHKKGKNSFMVLEIAMCEESSEAYHLASEKPLDFSSTVFKSIHIRGMMR